MVCDTSSDDPYGTFEVVMKTETSTITQPGETFIDSAVQVETSLAAVKSDKKCVDSQDVAKPGETLDNSQLAVKPNIKSSSTDELCFPEGPIGITKEEQGQPTKVFSHSQNDSKF